MSSKHVNLLSFNASLAPFVWHPYWRIDLLAQQKATLQADVINLQEVHTYDMLWRLRRRLTHLPYISYKLGLIGPQAGLVTLSKWPIETTQLNRLSLHKGALITSLDNMSVANVHLLANTDGDWAENNRFYPKQKMQLTKLNVLLSQRSYKDRPIILSGDFNLAKTSSLYSDFMEQGAWRDMAEQDSTPTFHGDFLPRGRNPQRIDYVFTRSSITSLHSERIFKEKVAGTFLSNHMGLLVRLEL